MLSLIGHTNAPQAVYIIEVAEGTLALGLVGLLSAEGRTFVALLGSPCRLRARLKKSPEFVQHFAGHGITLPQLDLSEDVLGNVTEFFHRRSSADGRS